MTGRGRFLLRTRLGNRSGEPRLPRSLLVRLLDAAYRARREPPAALDLAVLDDDAMAVLNRRHLGRDRPTDVLAFDDGERERGGRIRLGDVAISAETARREAGSRGVRFEHELAFYALHGLFHLLGMRDDGAAERRAMLAEQAEAMRAFAVGAGGELLFPDRLWPGERPPLP